MSKSLRELEKRLKDEPENLGLRVSVAAAMREAGRHKDAVELYRSVAVAYRDQGRAQQAIAVCRSLLEIAPDDVRCHALLASLVAGHKGSAQQDTVAIIAPQTPQTPRPPTLPPNATAERPPERRSSLDETPLPRPMPYHVADPTTSSLQRLSDPELPAAEGVETRPGSEPGARPEVSGIANAARRISASLIASTDEAGLHEGPYDTLDVASELDTRQRPRIDTSELAKISMPPPTAPLEKIDKLEIERMFDKLEVDDDAVTPVPGIPQATETDTEEELTVPLDVPEPSTNVRDPAAVRAPVVRPVSMPPPRTSVSLRRGTSPPPPPPPPPRPRPVRLATPPPTPLAAPTTATGSAVLASPFFSALPPARRVGVLSRFHKTGVAAGATVIRQGEADHPLVLVASGRLELRAERADGSVVVVAVLGGGEFVGEVALLSRMPSAISVIAVTDCELMTLAPRDFYEIAGAFPALWAQLKDCAERRTREHVAKLKR